MTPPNIPCLILGYARTDALIQLIQKADFLGFNPIYISLDGPKDSDVADAQSQLKNQISIIASNLSATLYTKFSSLNLGVRKGVISGIDWFFENESLGAIFEDDLLVSDDFLEFIRYGLLHLSENPDALLVSGCRFSNISTKVAATNYPLIWGWATTRSNWRIMRSAIFGRPKVRLSMDAVRNYWQVGSLRVYKGKIDTWDIPLANFMRFSHFYCLLPPVNLTSNVGFDLYAAHTKKLEFPLGMALKRLPNEVWQNKQLATGIEQENAFLEKFVYKISFRHRFSMFRFFLADIFSPIMPTKTR